MNTFLNGFGDVAVQSTAVAQPTTWDKIGNILNNVVKPAADIYSQVKQPSGSSSQPAPTAPTPAPWNSTTSTPAPAAQDNTKKYLLLGGLGIGAVAAIYFVTRKKGKK